MSCFADRALIVYQWLVMLIFCAIYYKKILSNEFLLYPMLKFFICQIRICYRQLAIYVICIICMIPMLSVCIWAYWTVFSLYIFNSYLYLICYCYSFCLIVFWFAIDCYLTLMRIHDFFFSIYSAWLYKCSYILHDYMNTWLLFIWFCWMAYFITKSPHEMVSITDKAYI